MSHPQTSPWAGKHSDHALSCPLVEKCCSRMVFGLPLSLWPVTRELMRVVSTLITLAQLGNTTLFLPSPSFAPRTVCESFVFVVSSHAVSDRSEHLDERRKRRQERTNGRRLPNCSEKRRGWQCIFTVRIQNYIISIFRCSLDDTSTLILKVLSQNPAWPSC